MDFHTSEQYNEIEVLECLYYHPGEFTKISSKAFALNLVPSPELEQENHVAITLFIEYTPKYPEEAPNWRLEQCKNLSSTQITEVESIVNETIDISIGDCMIYNVADRLQSWLVENNTPQKSMYEEMMNRIDENQDIQQDENLEEDSDLSENDSDYETYKGIQNKMLCDPEERVDEDTFLFWAENFKKEMEDNGIWKRSLDDQGLTGREMFEIDSSLAELYSFSLADQ